MELLKSIIVVIVLFQVQSLTASNLKDDRPVLSSCCQLNEVLKVRTMTCVESEVETNVTVDSEPIYSQNLEKNSGEKVADVFRVDYEKNVSVAEYEHLSKTMFDIDGNIFLTKGGLYAEHPNRFLRYKLYTLDQFCFGKVGLIIKGVRSYQIHYFTVREALEEDYIRSYCIVAVSLLSCVLLSIVLSVYALLPKLRDSFEGVATATMVFSLFCALLVQAVTQCYVLTISRSHARQAETNKSAPHVALTIYFFILASFFWMNVMSINMFQCFYLRPLKPRHQIRRKINWRRYLMFSAYAWGTPLLMTLGVKYIDKMNLKSMPYIVKPIVGKESYAIGKKEGLLYLYAPIVILLSCNIIMFSLTAGKMCSDGTRKKIKKHKHARRNRFCNLFAISIFMGVNWVLEVISRLSTIPAVTYFCDIYSSSIGVTIFLILVWKRKIWRQLQKRFSGVAVAVQTPRRGRLASDSDTSCISTQSSTVSLQTNQRVSLNPDGQAV